MEMKCQAQNEACGYYANFVNYNAPVMVRGYFFLKHAAVWVTDVRIHMLTESIFCQCLVSCMEKYLI